MVFTAIVFLVRTKSHKMAHEFWTSHLHRFWRLGGANWLSHSTLEIDAGLNSSARKEAPMRLLTSVIVIASFFILEPALAYDPYDLNNCNGVAWDDTNAVTAAKIVTRPRVNFVKSPYDDNFKAEGCPAPTAACQKRSFLVYGDIVLTGRSQRDFTCIDYVLPLSKKRIWATGWLPTRALEKLRPAPAPKASDWIGTWHPGARIEISDGGNGKLRIDATRVIVTTSGDTKNGTFTALVTPGSDTLTFVDSGANGDDCKVRMQRVGPWLLVEDNGGCGGAGVSFLGLYRRR